MISVADKNPFEACTSFASEWLKALSQYDLARLEQLIDVNESGGPLAESFPPPQGFNYASLDQTRNWTVHFLNADERGLGCDFEVPFVEQEFRPMMARFYMRRQGAHLEVWFEALVPT